MSGMKLAKKYESGYFKTARFKEVICAALPVPSEFDRFIDSACMYIARNARSLQGCDELSVIESVRTCAELGLSFSPALQQAYIVAYKDQATFMPGYRGLCELARRSGTIRSIEAVNVYDGDVFHVRRGTSPSIEHELKFESTGDQHITHTYAVARFNGGGEQFEVLPRADVEKVQAAAKTQMVWGRWWGEMAKKTAVKRLFKLLPASALTAKAIEIDNRLESGEIVEDAEVTKPVADQVLDDIEQIEDPDEPDGGKGGDIVLPADNGVEGEQPESSPFALSEEEERKQEKAEAGTKGMF